VRTFHYTDQFVKAIGCPVFRAINFAKRVNQEVDLVGVIIILSLSQIIAPFGFMDNLKQLWIALWTPTQVKQDQSHYDGLTEKFKSNAGKCVDHGSGKPAGTRASSACAQEKPQPYSYP
jgi:hypothetical protein